MTKEEFDNAMHPYAVSNPPAFNEELRLYCQRSGVDCSNFPDGRNYDDLVIIRNDIFKSHLTNDSPCLSDAILKKSLEYLNNFYVDELENDKVDLKVPNEMIYTFTLKLFNVYLEKDDLEDRLHACRFDDSILFKFKGEYFLQFDRMSKSKDEAVSSAITQIDSSFAAISARLVDESEGAIGIDTVNKQDEVNAPKHYASSEGIECIDYIKQVLTEEQFKGFCHGNVIKYQHRYSGKNGKQDLEKAGWYLRKMIDNLGGD